MPSKKKAVTPSDADTIIRALRETLVQHGWDATGSQVDSDGSVIVSGKAVPPPEPEADEAE